MRNLYGSRHVSQCNIDAASPSASSALGLRCVQKNRRGRRGMQGKDAVIWPMPIADRQTESAEIVESKLLCSSIDGKSGTESGLVAGIGT